MRTIRHILPPALAIFLLLLRPFPGEAQRAVPRDLSLEDALLIARGENPTFQAVRNEETVAEWVMKSAYGSLFPSAQASSGFSWQGSGEQRFGSVTLGQLGFRNQPAYYFSSYNLGLSYLLDGRTVLALPAARANQEATLAQTRSAEANLVLAVTQAYLEVLRQEEGKILAEREVERAAFNLRLAEGRREVGSGTPLDVRQAEVALGRARVNLLRAENGMATARYRLLQQIGAEPQEELRLTTRFAVAEPVWREAELYARALERNPRMQALRAQQKSRDYQVGMARSAFLPTLSISAGMSGFTREAANTGLLVEQAQSSALAQVAQCEALNELYRRLTPPLPTQDCSRYLFTEVQRQTLISENSAFPFNFTRQPPSASLVISLPLFQNLGRQRELEQARVGAEGARLQLREQELALKADIAAGLATLRTAYEAALIEEQNQVWADEQLRLAQERYRLGSATFLELVEAETVKAQADRERVAAIFVYHDARAGLEALVGAQLRIP